MNERVLKTNFISPVSTFNWAFIDQPRTDKNNPEKPPYYSVTVLMEKSDPKVITKLVEMNQCIKDALEKRFEGKIPAKFYTPLKDGDVVTNAEDEPVYPGFWFFEAKGKDKPGVVDANREIILTPSTVWSGCKGRVSINFGGYEMAGKKGVTCYLQNVQVTDNSAPKMGGRKSAENDFEE